MPGPPGAWVSTQLWRGPEPAPATAWWTTGIQLMPSGANVGGGLLPMAAWQPTTQIPVEFRPAWFDGAPEIKSRSRSRSRAARFASWLLTALRQSCVDNHAPGCTAFAKTRPLTLLPTPRVPRAESLPAASRTPGCRCSRARSDEARFVRLRPGRYRGTPRS